MVSEKSRRIIEIIPALLFLIPFFILGVGMSFFVMFSPTITFEHSAEMVRDLANACITISSIILAAILAITAILINRTSAKKMALWLLEGCLFPIYGIITGLIALYYSFLEDSFEFAKGFLGLSLLLTILSILAIYAILRFKRDRLLDDGLTRRLEEKDNA